MPFINPRKLSACFCACLLLASVFTAKAQQGTKGNSTVNGAATLKGNGVTNAAGYVQEKDCHWFGGSGTSETCAFPNPPAAGDGIAFFTFWNNPTGSTLSTVADLNSAAYTNTPWASGATNCDLASNYAGRVYTLPNSVSGANAESVKATWLADPGAGDIVMFEGSNTLISAMVDAADCQHVASATSGSSPSITPSVNGDILFGVALDANFNTRTWTAGTNVAWTLPLTFTNSSWFGAEYFAQATAAPVTANFSINTADPMEIAIIALKP